MYYPLRILLFSFSVFKFLHQTTKVYIGFFANIMCQHTTTLMKQEV